jgi:SAM-dependent methyltransferase
MVNTAGTRPAWRQAASWARTRIYRLTTPIDRLVRWNADALLPPAHLRIYYYRTWRPEAFVRACEGARLELTSRGLKPEHRVLDIGCGIGNLAIGLVDYLKGGYDGMDVHPEAVAWCQQAITPRYPSFRFHRADLSSRAYNPDGRDPSSSYRFPFADRSFNAIFLGSVFTHMLPDDVESYIREISRLLAPGGMCVASYFLLNEETRRGIDTGRSFLSFGATHSSGLCRLHDATKPEAAVALEESFVRRIHQDARLQIRDVRRGGWWDGAQHDQDVVTATP